MIDKKIKDTFQTQIENRYLGFKSELQTMKDRIKEMEKHKQSTQEGGVEENHNLRDRIKELEEKLTNNSTLSNMENKLDIKPIVITEISSAHGDKNSTSSAHSDKNSTSSKQQ
jgi:predicted nuclease with TOPRIM domain